MNFIVYNESYLLYKQLFTHTLQKEPLMNCYKKGAETCLGW